MSRELLGYLLTQSLLKGNYYSSCSRLDSTPIIYSRPHSALTMGLCDVFRGRPYATSLSQTRCSGVVYGYGYRGELRRSFTTRL